MIWLDNIHIYESEPINTYSIADLNSQTGFTAGVDGEVDFSQVGSYYIKYTVTDEYGSIATKRRKVDVTIPPITKGTTIIDISGEHSLVLAPNNRYTFYLIGGGGGGGNYVTTNSGGSGGGGGGVMRKTITVSKYTNINLFVGSGGSTGEDGTDTALSLIDISYIAYGGKTGYPINVSGGIGGLGGTTTMNGDINGIGGGGGDAKHYSIASPGKNGYNYGPGGGGGGSGDAAGGNGGNGALELFTGGGGGGGGDGKNGSIAMSIGGTGYYSGGSSSNPATGSINNAQAGGGPSGGIAGIDNGGSFSRNCFGGGGGSYGGGGGGGGDSGHNGGHPLAAGSGGGGAIIYTVTDLNEEDPVLDILINPPENNRYYSSTTSTTPYYDSTGSMLNSGGSWTANSGTFLGDTANGAFDNYPCAVIDLGRLYNVKSIQIQDGSGGVGNVTQFEISSDIYNETSGQYIWVVLENFNTNSPNTYDSLTDTYTYPFTESVITRYIKVKPSAWNTSCSMRIGFVADSTPIPETLEYFKTFDTDEENRYYSTQLTETYNNDTGSMLNSNGGWKTDTDNDYQSIILDNLKPRYITGIVVRPPINEDSMYATQYFSTTLVLQTLVEDISNSSYKWEDVETFEINSSQKEYNISTSELQFHHNQYIRLLVTTPFISRYIRIKSTADIDKPGLRAAILIDEDADISSDISNIVFTGTELIEFIPEEEQDGLLELLPMSLSFGRDLNFNCSTSLYDTFTVKDFFQSQSETTSMVSYHPYPAYVLAELNPQDPDFYNNIVTIKRTVDFSLVPDEEPIEVYNFYLEFEDILPINGPTAYRATQFSGIQFSLYQNYISINKIQSGISYPVGSTLHKETKMDIQFLQDGNYTITLYNYDGAGGEHIFTVDPTDHSAGFSFTDKSILKIMYAHYSNPGQLTGIRGRTVYPFNVNIETRVYNNVLKTGLRDYSISFNGEQLPIATDGIQLLLDGAVYGDLYYDTNVLPDSLNLPLVGDNRY